MEQRGAADSKGGLPAAVSQTHEETAVAVLRTESIYAEIGNTFCFLNP